MNHLNFWSVVFFISGYITAISMIFYETFFINFAGIALMAYLNYMLISELKDQQ